MDNSVILRLDGVSKSFAKVEKDDITNALENIDLTMKSGEFISLVGASGCGKSTILRLIAGLITPTMGTVTINGKEITGPGNPFAGRAPGSFGCIYTNEYAG